MKSVSEWPPNLPCSSTDLNILVGFVERRSIGPSGVELFGLHYNCAELGQIRRSLTRGEKAKVKYDPNDISRIYVWDKVGNSFLMVPALNQDYTAGLTLWQHEAIKKYTRQFLQSLVDAESLCRAKENIQEIVGRERLLTGKALRRARRVSVRVKPAAGLPVDDSPTGESRLADMMKNGGGTIKFLPARSETADIAGDETGTGSTENTGEVAAVDPNEGWGASYDLPRSEDTYRGE